MSRRPVFRHPRYELVRLIGEGGMGRVYLARDRLQGSSVALKLYPARAYDERIRSEFLALRELRHPAIAKALHFGVSETSGAPFFTLEYVEGSSLADYVASLAAGAPAAAERRLAAALWIFTVVTSAVAYLHRRGILHLDVKPDNILVVDLGPDFPPHPVLIDFGLVHRPSSRGARFAHGTLPYMAPEFFSGGAPGPPADVYALGATFYRVLSGRYPIPGTTYESFAKAHRELRPRPLPDGPPELEGVLLRALAKEPSHRFRDAGELHRALTQPALARHLGPFAGRSPVLFHDPDFVARTRELQALRRWLAGDRRAAPVFEVRGGSGFGKTRFLEKAATLIEVDGRTALSLRATEEAGSVLRECWRWLGLFDRASRARAPEAERIGEKAAGRLLPHLRKDTFLLVDDVHAADAGDRGFLERLARSLSQEPEPPGGGIVVARDAARAAGAEAEWTRAGLAESVELGPLALEEALGIDLEGLDGALAGFGEERVRSLKTRLYHQVGGHPLFYVRGLFDLAGNREEAAQLVPAAAIRTQVGALRGLDADLALSLSCLGRPASPAELQGILGASARDVEAALRRLRHAGLVASDGRRVRPIHESVREAVLACADGERERRAHARIARFLSSAARGSPSAEAGWHLLGAGDVAEALRAADRWVAEGARAPGGPREKSVDFLLLAADRAGRRSERGRRYLESACDLLSDLGRYREAFEILRELAAADCSGGARGEDRARRLRKLGSVAHRIARADEALEALRACVGPEAEREAPVESLKARVELANLHHFRGESDLALECSSRGVEIWRRSPAARKAATLETAIHLHAILGQVQIRKLRFADAVSVLEDGLALAERAGSRADVAVLLNNLALAHHLAGQLAEGLRIFRRAESIAAETQDVSALASIRSNAAQILAKMGRFRAALRILDELEGSPAVRGSHRLRLGCLYSRGLVANILRLDAEEVWSRVEELTDRVGDPFLRRMAAVCKAECRIGRGLYSEARRLLRTADAEWKEEPVVAALKTARRAFLEALAGHVPLARALRARLRELGGEVPDQPKAWNRYYLGLSAMETGDRDEAVRELEAARDAFRSMGLAVGEVGCSFALAELHLRSGGRAGAAAAERELRAARRRRLDAGPRPTSPFDVARDVLGAWVELARLLPDGEARGGPARRAAPRRGSARGGARLAAEEAAGLLARAAGDPALGNDPSLRELVEILSAAAARILGDEERARAASERARAVREELLRGLEPRDRIASGRRDPWKAAGLGPLRPPAADAKLEGRHAEALAEIVCAAREPRGGEASEPESPLARSLAAIGRCLRAERVEAISGFRSAASWERREPPGSSPSEGPREVLLAPVAGETLSFIRVVSAPGGGFSEGDRRFLDAAARGVLLPAARGSTSPAARPPGPEEDAETRTQPLAGTATRELPPARARPEALAQAAEEAGLLVTPTVARILETIERYAASDLPVLVTGESGTGKNLVAQLIHRLSRRSSGPFLVQTAGAVPPELFEADLFGYTSGAFTGAEKTRTGFLFQAAGGTFHLEEIGDLPPALQQLFLRVVEERHVRPLGASGPRPLDVRFVVSTHRDIDSMVRRGEFRKDLFFRLSGARIHLPPLRDRPEEVPLYAERIWREVTGSPIRLPRASLEVLSAHDWPGNLRELASVLRRLSLESSGVPGPKEVRAALGGAEARKLISADVFRSHSYAEAERALEEAYLLYLLDKHRGDLAAIAGALGTSTRSVYRRFERLGLKPSELARGTPRT